MAEDNAAGKITRKCWKLARVFAVVVVHNPEMPTSGNLKY